MGPINSISKFETIIFCIYTILRIILYFCIHVNDDILVHISRSDLFCFKQIAPRNLSPSFFFLFF